MAWNVVIAGGGFAGMTLRAGAGEAAAEAVGAAARWSTTSTSSSTRRSCPRPRRACSSHVTWSRRCATSSTAPTCGSERSAATTPSRGRSTLRSHEGETERAPLRPAGDLGRARSRGRSRSPGSTSTRSGSRASPTRSGCATTWSRRSRLANSDRGPGARRERAAHLRLRRRRLRRARGARRAPGLRRRRDGPLSARPPARDALDPGRGRPTGCCPRSTPSWPTTP